MSLTLCDSCLIKRCLWVTVRERISRLSPFLSKAHVSTPGESPEPWESPSISGDSPSITPGGNASASTPSLHSPIMLADPFMVSEHSPSIPHADSPLMMENIPDTANSCSPWSEPESDLGTPVRPLSPLVPDPLSPPEWDFTKFYLPGMPRDQSRDPSRDNTLRKHHTLPRDFISPETVHRDFASPQRNRYHSESSLGYDERYQDRYGSMDRRSEDRFASMDRRDMGPSNMDRMGSNMDRRDMGSLDRRDVGSMDRRQAGVREQNRRNEYHDVMEGRGDQPLRPYRVLFNYVPQNDDELDIREGDHVYVLEKCDDGWFVGTSTRTGLFGTFPGNYVQPV